MVARAEFGFQRQRAGGKGRARRDDGVCLTTLRDRRAGPVKGGVRRQAPSRLREPLKAVMEPAPPPSRPDSGPLATLPTHWSFCLKNGLSVTSRAVLSTFPALVPGLQFPYAVPIRNSGNKGPLEGLQTGTIKVFELCYLQEERMIAGCRTFSMTFSTTAGWNGRPTRLRPSM